MPRPRKLRSVMREPGVSYFKPQGVPMRGIGIVILAVEEYEALRLADFESMGQKGAAAELGVSQPTFCRMLDSARKKVSDAIINGKAIRIEGGRYRLRGRKG